MIDPNLERFYSLLTAGTGIARERHPDLERETAERAFEARQQVGLNYISKEESGIVHPPQAEREARLGEEWIGNGVAEVATWGYEFLKPIEALVDYTKLSDGAKVGLLNTEPHNTILRDPRFKHWGAGIYTELPEGLEEWQTRYYAVVWLSVEAPPAPTDPAPLRFSDVEPDDWYYDDIEELAELGIVSGYPDGTFRPKKLASRAEIAVMLNRLRKLP